MEQLKNYLATFIDDPDAVNIVLILLVLMAAASILKVLGFGLYKD